MDSSVTAFVQYARKEGLQGLLAVWPRPSSEAWAYIAAFGVVQALMQLFVPGEVAKGPVTPKGNVPVYVVRVVLRRIPSWLKLCQQCPLCRAWCRPTAFSAMCSPWQLCWAATGETELWC